MKPRTCRCCEKICFFIHSSNSVLPCLVMYVVKFLQIVLGLSSQYSFITLQAVQLTTKFPFNHSFCNWGATHHYTDAGNHKYYRTYFMRNGMIKLHNTIKPAKHTPNIIHITAKDALCIIPCFLCL